MAMLDLSGRELAAELLKIRADLPIILCTGYSAQVSEENAGEIGVREFCTKPLDREKLTAAVRRVLDDRAI